MNPQKLVRKVKGKFEVNLTLFYRKFAVLFSLAQLYEQIPQRRKYFTEEELKNIETYEKTNKEVDSFALEKAMVTHYDCNPNRPTCLYDFTMKVLMFDYQAFSIKDFDADKEVIYDYFYCGENHTQEDRTR